MKKLINGPLNVVREMLEGAVCFDPDLALMTDENVLSIAELAYPMEAQLPRTVGLRR
jgi:hypothetical protein